MLLSPAVFTVVAAVLSLLVLPSSTARDAGEQGYRHLRWAGLWGEGHMNRVGIHRPMYAVILAKALSCLQNANEQVRLDVKDDLSPHFMEEKWLTSHQNSGGNS